MNPIDWPAELDAWEAALADGRDVIEHDGGGRRTMTTLTDGELLQYMGDDASKWAAEFCKIAKNKGHDLDEGWMIGWFANAIEHSSDVRRARRTEATSPALNAPVRSAERAALDEAVKALRLLLADAERTAKNSFNPSFIDTRSGREQIPWRDGWRRYDHDGFEICERARRALQHAATLVPGSVP